MMNKLITALFVVILSLEGLAQQQYSTQLINVSEQQLANTVGWVSYVDNPDFKIEFQFIDCDPVIGYDSESVVLRVTNKTLTPQTISWHAHLHYDGVCKTCDYPEEYYHELHMKPKQEVAGECDIYSENSLKIFSKFIDKNYKKGEKLTAFQLARLRSTK